MSGIYICGMEMPKNGEYKHVYIYDTGEVTVEVCNKYEVVCGDAVAVPDHCDLIDKNALKCEVLSHTYTDDANKDLIMVFRDINLAPVIIPADKEE